MSVELIRNSNIDYDFRTTVVPGIHREKDFGRLPSGSGEPRDISYKDLGIQKF